MKKLRKYFSFVLILAMIVSVFAGIVLYNDDGTKAIAGAGDTVNKSITVLEIVPDRSMAEFGYLIAGQEPIDVTAYLNNGSIASGTRDAFKNALKNNGIGTFSGNTFTNSNLFTKTMLPQTDASGSNINWSVNLVTVSVSDINNNSGYKAMIDAADLIVVSQSMINGIPYNTTNGAAPSNTSLATGTDLSWDVAWEIMKKCSGADGLTPAKFMFDFSIVSKTSTSSFGYATYYANQDANYQNQAATVSSSGSSRNAYKLGLALCLFDNPSTFYGIYFNGTSSSHGINSKGQLVGLNSSVIDGNTRDEGILYSKWSPEALIPRFLYNHSYQFDGSFATIISELKMNATSTGWGNFSLNFANDSQKVTSGGMIFTPTSGGKISGFDSAFISSTQSMLNKAYSPVKGYSGDIKILAIYPNGYTKSYSEIESFESRLVSMYADAKLAGGVHVDKTSMFQFVGTTKIILEEYDAIYLASAKDGRYDDFRNAYGNSSYLYYKTGKNGMVGNDLSARRLQELSAFVSSGNAIVVAEDLTKSGGVQSGTNMATFLSSLSYNGTQIFKDYGSDQKFDTSGSNCFDQTKFKANLDRNVASLGILRMPNIYSSGANFEFTGQNNDGYDYYYTSSRSSNFKEYINDNSKYANPSAPTENEKKNARKLNFTLRVNSLSNSGTYKLKLFMDMNTDGYFNESPAKFGSNGVRVEEGSYRDYGELFDTKNNISPNVDFAYTFSGLPAHYVGPVTWKLVLYDSSDNVVDSYIGYSAARAEQDDMVQKINILQILPDSDSLDKLGNTDTTNFIELPTVVLPTKAEIKAAKNTKGSLLNYKTDTQTNLFNLYKYFDGLVQIDVKNGSGVTPTTLKFSDGKAAQVILSNMAMFEYFMEQSKDYDINVKRVSVSEFKKEVANGTIHNDYQTGCIFYENPDPDESGEISCDLMMIGFADNMTDITDNTALNMITRYVEMRNNVLVGRGVVTSYRSQKLADAMAPFLGVATKNGSTVTYNKKTYEGGAVTYGNGGIAEMTKSNDGTITRYPYDVPDYLKMTNGWEAPFQLDMEDTELSVWYSLYYATRGSSADKAYYGVNDVRNNYFMYRKGNVTYINMGFGQGQALGQKSATLRLPEAVLLVNTLISTYEPSPSTIDPPEINVINPGVTEYTETKTEIIGGTPVEVEHSTDYFYVDFDAAGSEMSTSDDPVPGDTYIVEHNGELCEKIVFIAKNDNGKSLISFTSTTGTGSKNIPLVVYNSTGSAATITSGKYEIENGQTYTIYVPIKDTYYSNNGLSDYALGSNNSFTIESYTCDKTNPSAESNKSLTITRRGLFSIT